MIGFVSGLIRAHNLDAFALNVAVRFKKYYALCQNLIFLKINYQQNINVKEKFQALRLSKFWSSLDLAL